MRAAPLTRDLLHEGAPLPNEENAYAYYCRGCGNLHAPPILGAMDLMHVCHRCVDYYIAKSITRGTQLIDEIVRNGGWTSHPAGCWVCKGDVINSDPVAGPLISACKRNGCGLAMVRHHIPIRVVPFGAQPCRHLHIVISFTGIHLAAKAQRTRAAMYKYLH